VRLGAHDVGYSHEVLKLLGRYNRKHFYCAAGFGRPDRGETHGVQHLGRIVQNYQELAHAFLPV
jgi:hypothetical protein